jgi:acetyltransferase-like isoleucine patch superfamily enzyme
MTVRIFNKLPVPQNIRKYPPLIRSHVRSWRDVVRAIGEVWRYLVLRLRFGGNLEANIFFVHQGGDIDIGSHAHVRIGFPVHFMREFTGRFYGHVTIGDNVFFNRGCYVAVHEALTIGDNCLFGEHVSIHDENHNLGRGCDPIGSRGFTTAPIVIGKNVWVGAKATILQGVHIGDNAVIGANAVVTRDIPPNAIAVGIPARVVREL